MASLANKLPKPCQVLIYLTFAAERNCQKFKRVHFKHQTSFHHLYSGLRPNFYSWVFKAVAGLYEQTEGPVSRPDQWCPDCCPVPGRHQISPANKLVLASAGQCWAVLAAGPRSHHHQPQHSFILSSMCQKLIIQCAEMHSQVHLHFQAFSLWFSLSWMTATFLLQTSSFEQQHLDWKFQRSGL